MSKINPNTNPTEVPPKDAKTELTEEELAKASGGFFAALFPKQPIGGVASNPITISKKFDKASPVLLD